MSRKTKTLSRREAIGRTGTLLGAALTGSYAAGPGPARAAEGAGSSPFIFCLNTATIRGQKLGLVREAEVAAQAGFQAIEPWVESIDRYTKDGGSLRELRQRIADLGLSIEDAIAFPQWLAEDEAKRAQAMETVKTQMDTLAQIGCKRLAMPPVGATDKPGLDLTVAAERYRAALELGDRMGVAPQLELWGFSKNLNRLGPCACVAIEAHHPKACVLADVFHLYKGGSDFDGLRFMGGGLLQVFHMNDYPADPPRERISDGYRVLPGDGTAPLTQILRNLRSTGGQKVLSLELFNRKYFEQDALQVAKAGLQKMKAAVASALS